MEKLIQQLEKEKSKLTFSEEQKLKILISHTRSNGMSRFYMVYKKGLTHPFFHKGKSE